MMTCLCKWCTPTATTKVKKDYWWCLFRVPTSVLLSPNFIQSCYLYDFLHKFAQFSIPLTTHIKNEWTQVKYRIKSQHYKKHHDVPLCSSRDVDWLCEEWVLMAPLKLSTVAILIWFYGHPYLTLLPENNKTGYADKRI
jgi:hypothetical protein